MLRKLLRSSQGLLIFTALIMGFQNCGEGFDVANLATSGTATFQSSASCESSAPIPRAPVRLLSSQEYDHIAADILLSQRAPSSDAKFVEQEPGPSGFSNTGITSDVNAPVLDVSIAEKYWTAASSLAEEVIARKGQASFYSQNAACAGQGSSVAESCYDSIVRNVGLKLWRRPISEAAPNNEFARLKAILKSGSFDVGFRDFLRALLISPNHLVVALTPSNTVAAGQAFNLNDFQLASRLAFFIWQSGPDDQLLGLAKTGSLANPMTLQAQVERMLKDARSKRLAKVFTNEWVGANAILGLGITAIPTTTLNSMILETQYMFEDIVSNNRSLVNMLNADYSFLNKTMADYYGVTFTGANANQFYKTSLATTPRRGVMNHASFLIATAGAPTESHPVMRGKSVALKFDCFEIAPPPATLDTSLSPNIPSGSTPREALAIHTQKAQCAGCHAVLDPYGMALESYDSKGLWRTNYLEIGNRPIDTSGVLPTGQSFANTEGFMSVMGSNPNTKSCLVRKVMSLGLTRKMASAEDLCNSKAISEVSMNPNSTFSSLVANIVTSRQFRMQTTEAQ